MNTLGESSYPTQFAGAAVVGGDELDVYAVANDARLLQAVAASDTQGFPYTVITVPDGSQALSDLTSRIAGQGSALKAAGVDLGFFGPDPAGDSVKVTLETPTASDLSAFSATTAPRASPLLRTQRQWQLPHQGLRPKRDGLSHDHGAAYPVESLRRLLAFLGW